MFRNNRQLSSQGSIQPVILVIFSLLILIIVFVAWTDLFHARSFVLSFFESGQKKTSSPSCSIPVDGGWSDWSDCDCPSGCGKGLCPRTRTCTNPTPTCGGQDCQGVAKRVDTCQSEPCLYCGNGVCSDPEYCLNCPEDCGECPGCGDKVCGKNENCEICPQDCGKCPSECGNFLCEFDENCQNCPKDCGQCCGNNRCDIDFFETCKSCPKDCGPCPKCGDGTCNLEIGFEENCQTCPQDCGECCGNGLCEPQFGETCVSSTGNKPSACEDCGACCGETCSSMGYCAKNPDQTFQICGKTISCPQCCQATCENLGLTCGTQWTCKYGENPATRQLLTCGDKNCDCTDVCYAGSDTIDPQTICLDNKIYVCRKDAQGQYDGDICNDWDMTPANVYACPNGCDDNAPTCNCEDECEQEGRTWCGDGAHANDLFTCIKSLNKYEDCNVISEPYPCANGCVQDDGGARCACEDECAAGSKKCVIKEERNEIGDVIATKYLLYQCAEAHDFDTCTELINPRECEFGCSDDGKSCAAPCDNSCTPGEKQCRRYDSNQDGEINSADKTAIFTCGFKDNQDICPEWIDPQGCPNEDGICRPGDTQCRCNDCRKGEEKCVLSPVFTLDGLTYTPKMSTCIFDEDVGCTRWADPKDCGLEDNPTACVLGSSTCCQNECSPDDKIICEKFPDGQSERYKCKRDPNTGCLTRHPLETCRYGCEKDCGLIPSNTGRCKTSQAVQFGKKCERTERVCSDGQEIKCVPVPPRLTDEELTEWKYQNECNPKGWCDQGVIKECYAQQLPSGNKRYIKIPRILEECPYGCLPGSASCSSPCQNDDGCKQEGQTICDSQDSTLYLCTNKNDATDDDICLEKVLYGSCPWGCNKDNTACAVCKNKCMEDGEQKCVEGKVLVCQKNDETGCLDWRLSDSQCEFGCSPETNDCRPCANDPGCTKKGLTKCFGDTKSVETCGEYDAQNGTPLDNCLEWGNPKKCPFGCDVNPLDPSLSLTCQETCPFDCPNPGPPNDDSNPNNEPTVSFTCGKHDICQNKSYDCGSCPAQCLKNDAYNITLVDEECYLFWNNRVIFHADDDLCLDENFEFLLDGYRYTKGHFKGAVGKKIFYEICRYPQ